MMKRKEKEIISAYIDGELSALESRRVEELLEINSVVKNYHREMSNLCSEVNSIPRVRVDEEKGFAQIQAKLNKSRAQTTISLFYRRFNSAFRVAALVVVVFLFSFMAVYVGGSRRSCSVSVIEQETDVIVSGYESLISLNYE